MTNAAAIKTQRETVSKCLTVFHDRYQQAEVALNTLELNADDYETQDYATRQFELQLTMIETENQIKEYTALWEKLSNDLTRLGY